MERRVVEDVYRASVVDQDPLCVIVPYQDANDECIVMWVVEASGVFFREANNKVVNSRPLWDNAR